MALETRTRWINIADLEVGHHLAGFGPVEHIVRRDNIVGVGNTHGAYTELNARTDVELYDGTYDENGRCISMSTDEYRASIRDEQSRR